MFKMKKRSFAVILLILILSVPSFSQENTEEAPVPMQTDAPIITEVPTEAPTAAPIITEAPTEETVVTEAPTEEAIVTEAPVELTEEAVVTEAPVEPTEESVTPTEAPVSVIPTRPQGEAVEMLLQYNPNASAESIAAMLQSLGATELERLPQIGVMRVLLPSSVSNVSSAQSTLQSNTLASSAGLLSMEAEEMWQVTAFPNDPLLPSFQTNFLDDTTPPYTDTYSIFMQSAWGVSPRDGQGVTVAVLDSGLDIHHPEFVGKYVTGWNFYDDWSNFDDLDYDGNDIDGDGYDYSNGHGTHVAGVIAAKTNNAIGVASMAYNAMILPVKVCGYYGCPTFEIAAGIIYAVDRGAKVINMSLGGGVPSTTVLGAVNYALSRNVIVVASAGNNGDTTNAINYPAAYPGVISVAALNPDATRAAFSNNNPLSNVTIAAPGVDIVSTWPLDHLYITSGYAYSDGTSMAAPHVSALAAMLIADGVVTTPAQFVQNLMCTSRDLGDSDSFGYGIINAYRALTWDSNSADCQISLPNDFITSPITITSPTFSMVQPVSDRSVTESTDDPEIDTVQPNQSLWYKFTPTVSGQYMVSSFGSGHDTLLAVYQGQPGALTELEANNDAVIDGAYQRRVTLVKGIPYYVQLGTNGSDMQSSYVQLNVNPALTLTTLQQENATFIRYTGSWNRVAQTGSNGGYVMTTTDNNATMSFLVRGRNLNLTRLVGPTQGDMAIFVDGVAKPVTSNYAAITRSTMMTVTLGANTGEWHLVTIRMGSSNAPLSIDALQAVDGTLPTAIVGATRLNENASAFGLSAWPVGANLFAFTKDLRGTNTVGDFVQFRTSGSAITIWRSVGAGTGEMEIFIDGISYDVVDNFITSLDSNTNLNASVPYSIANLPPRERVVRIVHNTPSTQFLFDGAQSVLQAALAPNVITDERSVSLVYTGIWAKVATSTTLANAGTISTLATDADGGNVQFMFNGNHLCIGYQQPNGIVDVYIDDVNVGQITANGASLSKQEWCTYTNGINRLTDNVHSVRLQVPAGSFFNLDFVRPVRRTIFTNVMNYIMETNTGFVYSGIWTTSTQASLNGTKFQGGSARVANLDNDGVESVSFTINGSGFVLYTALPFKANAAGFRVYVDGDDVSDRMDFTYQDTPLDFFPLWAGVNYFRPMAVGIVDIPTGIHHIKIEGVEIGIQEYDNLGNPTTIYYPPTPNLHFDGIRVLP